MLFSELNQTSIHSPHASSSLTTIYACEAISLLPNMCGCIANHAHLDFLVPTSYKRSQYHDMRYEVWNWYWRGNLHCCFVCCCCCCISCWRSCCALICWTCWLDCFCCWLCMRTRHVFPSAIVLQEIAGTSRFKIRLFYNNYNSFLSLCDLSC